MISGIEVDALGGAPGIHSARYAGRSADDLSNNAKLMSALKGVPYERRRARYRCALVLHRGSGCAAARGRGGNGRDSFSTRRAGSGGFGYDPYFWLPELDKTAC